MLIRIKQFLLFFGDLVCLYLSLFLTLILRYGPNFSQDLWQQHLVPFTIIYLIWLIVFYINDLYDLRISFRKLEFFSALVWSLIINGLMAVLFFYLIPYFGITPKTNLFLNLLFFSSLFLFWRLLLSRFMIKIGLVNHIIFISQNKTSEKIAQKIENNPVLGYKVIIIGGLEKIQEIKKIIKEKNIKTIVVDPAIYLQSSANLYEYLPLGIDILNLPTFLEKFEAAIPISETNKEWFLENIRETNKRTYEITKRGFEIILSFILGLISLILYPLIILIIKCSGPGPIFYTQERIGKNNKIFKIIKFRTMIPGAEKNGVQWAEENDKRITSIGKILRKTRLDELPQLWNILKGEMSFVGPRPERPEFIKNLEKQIPHYSLRHLIRPGLTGWSQINYPYGSSIEDSSKKLSYDLYYLKNRNFVLDLSIILKTIAVMLKFKGR